MVDALFRYSFISSTAYLSNYALSQLEAAKVSIFNNLSAFITVAAGVLILHETIDWYHLLGGVLVIGGVIGGMW